MQLEGLRYLAGDGGLPGARGVAALGQGEHRVAVGAVRVLCPELDRLGRARDRYEPAADYLDGPECLPGRRKVRRQGLRISSVGLQQVCAGSALRAAQFTESRAPVGSSASRTWRSPTTARAMATRWRSPPDSSSGKRSARLATPSSSRAFIPAGRAALIPTPSSSSGSVTFSTAVSPASRLKSWKT